MATPWEYHVWYVDPLELKGGAQEEIEQLNTWAEEGWELIDVVAISIKQEMQRGTPEKQLKALYFRRPKSSTPSSS